MPRRIPKAFISYRHLDAQHGTRVRAFALRLRDAGVDVALDQFFLDEHHTGPDEGWPKWSSDHASKSACVLIIGTVGWFDSFDKMPRLAGAGLGSACEADDIRTRIYEAGGRAEGIRVVIFDDADAAHISQGLRQYPYFRADRDFARIAEWAKTLTCGGSLHHQTEPQQNSSADRSRRDRRIALGLSAAVAAIGAFTWAWPLAQSSCMLRLKVVEAPVEPVVAEVTMSGETRAHRFSQRLQAVFEISQDSQRSRNWNLLLRAAGGDPIASFDIEGCPYESRDYRSVDGVHIQLSRGGG
nr:SEFIR domain-containing protein [Aquabacterium terrae]